MIVELRQYTLAPGRRDAFVALYDAEFVTSQADVGIDLLAATVDTADPDRFVWLRAHASWTARSTSLEAHYVAPHPAWGTHREACNAMIVDSDDVLLLDPLRLDRPSGLDGRDLHVTVVPVAADPGPALRTALGGLDASTWGVLVTAGIPNDFPRHPVRTDPAVVLLGPGPVAVPGALAPSGPVQSLRLTPTPGSPLR